MRNFWLLLILILIEQRALIAPHSQHLDPSQTISIRLFVSWLIYQCLFIYILCFFWWLAWCATLCFVNGFMPRVAANDMVVIVCQCDNVWFPISMWSWTFDEGGILSGRQSAVICHQLNELLSRHPLCFQWQYYIHKSLLGCCHDFYIVQSIV